MKFSVCVILTYSELFILLFLLPTWVASLYFGNFPQYLLVPLWAGVWIFPCVTLAKIPALVLDKMKPSPVVSVGLISLSLLRMTLILAGFIVIREFIDVDMQKPVVLVGVSFFFFTILMEGFLKLFFQSLK